MALFRGRSTHAQQQHANCCGLLLVLLLALAAALLPAAVVASASAAVPIRVSHLTLPLLRPSKPPSLINYTLYAPANFNPRSNNHASTTPAVFLMNGFNVPSEAYAQLCTLLAQAGLIVATAAETIPLPFTIPGLPRPGCPAVFTIITGSHLNLLINATLPDDDDDDQFRDAVKFQLAARLNRVMLMAHSNGGVIAAYMLNGTCDTPSPATAFLCDTYQPQTDNQGRNILAAITEYEGYGGRNITVPRGSFVAYIKANGSLDAAFPNYVNTSGCKAYMEMDGANHYGLCDFVPNINNTQVWPCAFPSSTDPPGFTVTEQQQAYNIQRVADAAVAVATSFEGGTLKAGEPDLAGLSPGYYLIEEVCPEAA